MFSKERPTVAKRYVRQSGQTILWKTSPQSRNRSAFQLFHRISAYNVNDVIVPCKSFHWTSIKIITVIGKVEMNFHVFFLLLLLFFEYLCNCVYLFVTCWLLLLLFFFFFVCMLFISLFCFVHCFSTHSHESYPIVILLAPISLSLSRWFCYC